MSEPHVKGVAIRGILSGVDRLCPPGTVDKMLGLLPPELANKVKHQGFVSAGWYPLSDYRAILDAVMQASGGGIDIIRQISRQATRDDFRGIYRLLTFVLSPEFVIKRAGGVFSRYYDTGTLTIPVARDGYVEANFRSCVGFNHVMWQDATAGAMAILEVCGAKDLRVTAVRGGGDGDVDYDLVAEWR